MWGNPLGRRRFLSENLGWGAIARASKVHTYRVPLWALVLPLIFGLAGCDSPQEKATPLTGTKPPVPKVAEAKTETPSQAVTPPAESSNPAAPSTRKTSAFDRSGGISPLVTLSQTNDKDLNQFSNNSFDVDQFRAIPRPSDSSQRQESSAEKGLKFLEQKKYREAATVFQAALRNAPKDPQLLFLTGYALANSDPSIAGTYLDRALQQKPDHLQALLWRGVLSLKSRRWEQADRDLTRALELEGPPREILTRRCGARYSLRKFADAEADATSAIEAGENSGEALSLRCLCRCALGKNEDAMADFSACESLNLPAERMKQCQQALKSIAPSGAK